MSRERDIAAFNGHQLHSLKTSSQFIINCKDDTPPPLRYHLPLYLKQILAPQNEFGLYQENDSVLQKFWELRSAV